MTDDLTPRPLLYPATPIAAAPAAGRPGSVAIVMRTRDRPVFLPRALDSVCAQSWPDWHLYLVNDGGDPAAVEAALAARATTLRGRVSSIHLPAPRGISGAANAGLAQAREEFLVIHDDDDGWDPGYLAAVTEFLLAPAHAGFVGVTTACTLVEERLTPEGIEEVRRHVWPHHQGLVELRRALVDTQIPPIALTIRRAALSLIGGLNEALSHVSDLEFNHRLMMLGEIGFIPRSLATYHHRTAGTGGAARNSIAAGTEREEQALRLRNGLLRSAMAVRPEMFGALQALLQAMEEDRARIEARIAAMEQRTEARGAALEQALGRIERQLARGADLCVRLAAVQAAVDEMREVSRWQRQMLRPIRWAWRRALPLRRAVARARGRADASRTRPGADGTRG